MSATHARSPAIEAGAEAAGTAVRFDADGFADDFTFDSAAAALGSSFPSFRSATPFGVFGVTGSSTGGGVALEARFALERPMTGTGGGVGWRAASCTVVPQKTVCLSRVGQMSVGDEGGSRVSIVPIRVRLVLGKTKAIKAEKRSEAFCFSWGSPLTLLHRE